MSTELYKRFSNFFEKFSLIGSNITKLNKTYYDAQVSYKKRLLPQAKRIV